MAKPLDGIALPAYCRAGGPMKLWFRNQILLSEEAFAMSLDESADTDVLR